MVAKHTGKLNVICAGRLLCAGITWHNDVLMTCSIDGYIKSWRVFRSEEELKVKLEQAESKYVAPSRSVTQR